MRALLGNPKAITLPVTLTCPKSVCGQVWTARGRFELPGWWFDFWPDNDGRCPVCGTPGRVNPKNEEE